MSVDTMNEKVHQLRELRRLKIGIDIDTPTNSLLLWRNWGQKS